MLKKFVGIFLGIALISIPVAASAHVIVTPSQVGISKELVFNVSVPNEQQTPVVNLKLTVPDGVTGVIPTTKPGWTIQTTTNGDTKNPIITSIVWSGGTIPVGQRDDFTFDAQVPDKATSLNWKAYQTYADGTVVHWDQKPAGSDDSTGNAGPYSVTTVVNDLTSKPATSSSPTNDENRKLNITLGIAVVAVVLGGIVLIKRR